MDDRILKTLRALSDEKRFYIVRLLLTNDLCVGALAGLLNISKPAVSQHLRVLREAGLVRGEKIGYWTHYRVEKTQLLEIIRRIQVMIEETGRRNLLCPRLEPTPDEAERRSLIMCQCNSCQKPENLKGQPAECPPEVVEQCHGDAGSHPCLGQCDQPEKLKGKPGSCTPQQVRECHGDQEKPGE